MSDIKAARKNTRVDCCLTRSPNEQKFLLLFSEIPYLFEGPNRKAKDIPSFLKKRSKKLLSVSALASPDGLSQVSRKFFGSFFQKRAASFA